MSHRSLIASLVLALFAGHAAAEDVRLYRPGETVDPQDVMRILGDDPTQAGPVIKMRSLRLLDDGPASSLPVDRVAMTEGGGGGGGGGGAAPAETPTALSLPVQFAFDSADILPAARAQLDALAEGIRRLAPSRAVVIEGHTDATGPAEYNEDLSLRRAQAVQHYLVASQGIAPDRLHAIGLGEFGLLPGAQPTAAVNRRVQFRGE